MTALLLVAVLLLTSIAVNSMSTPVAVAAADDSFDELTADELVLELGAGWNLGNQMEGNINGNPGETAWTSSKVTPELMQAVADAGFKTVRIPCSYLNYIGSAPDYTIKESWLNRIGEVVDYAIDAGLYVIINIHGDGYHSVTGSWLLIDNDDQETVRAKYTAVWTQIATKFKDYDEHLIFESMNEVFDGTYGNPPAASYDNLNTLNQIFVDTVRQTGGNNAKRWLLVPGWNTNIDQTVGNYGFEIPEDNYRDSSVSSNRIIISVHYYDPWEFALREDTIVTQWGSIAKDSSKVASWGGESYMEGQIKKLYTNYTSKGYPVIIGEYGSVDKDNTTYRAHYAKMLCTYAKKYKCTPVLWDNSWNGDYGMAVFNRSTKTITQQEIVDAIMSVYDTPATAIELSSQSITFNELGATATLSAAVTPSYTNDTVKWTSSDTSVVTIEDGVITAIAFGTATITVTAGDITATCTVVVEEPSDPVELSESDLTVAIGTTGTIAATVNAEGFTVDDIVWTSDNESVATVSGGTVTALSAGTATITATIGDFSVSCTVTVIIPVESIEIDTLSLTLSPDESAQIIATVSPSDATEYVKWISSDEKVATVENGIVTAVGLGSATITAATSNCSAECVLEVAPPISLTAMGGSVRIVEPYGLRFGIELKKDDAYTKYYDSIIGYGTLIIPKKNLGDAALTFDTPSVKDVPAVNIYSEDSSQLTYTGVLVGIPKSSFYSDIVGRGYLKYSDVNGNEKIIYTDEIVRSYYQVASSAYTRYGNIANRTETEQAVYEKLEGLLAEMTDGDNVTSY